MKQTIFFSDTTASAVLILIGSVILVVQLSDNRWHHCFSRSCRVWDDRTSPWKEMNGNVPMGTIEEGQGSWQQVYKKCKSYFLFSSTRYHDSGIFKFSIVMLNTFNIDNKVLYRYIGLYLIVCYLRFIRLYVHIPHFNFQEYTKNYVKR